LGFTDVFVETQMIRCANPLAQYEAYKAEIDAAIANVLRGNRYILGPEVEALEHEFAQYIGVAHGIGVANGTDALELALRGLGVGEGAEVITVSHTAVATVAAIESAGATPVLVDVEADHYTLDPAQLDEVATDRTRAVIAVHLYGQAADLDAIAAFCRRRNIALIEDVSQAHGATLHGKRLGSFGDVACYSCYPTKNLGAIGDGGLVTTNDAGIAKRIRMLREYGWEQRYISDIAGRNSRLDEMQAAILRVKLRHLDADNARRRAIAASYSRGLDQFPVVRPATRNHAEHVFHLYVIRARQRASLMDGLAERGVAPGIHYPVPVHCQAAYRGRVRTAGSMRVTEQLAAEVLSLPLYPQLDDEAVQTVIDAVGYCFRPTGARA
jgi:dTDP-4-amino-4,6-dideoxygalactose transaminase